MKTSVERVSSARMPRASRAALRRVAICSARSFSSDAGRRLRAGIVAAVTGIDHHEEMTRLSIVFIHSDGAARLAAQRKQREDFPHGDERDRTRDGWGRAPRRVVVNDDRRGEIRIGAGGRDPQHDFISVAEPRDRVVGFADHLDHDSRAAVRLDRADARRSARPPAEQRARRNRDARCASSIQSSLPCVLRSSRGAGPLNPKCSSSAGPRCSIRAEVSTDGGTLARARTPSRQSSPSQTQPPSVSASPRHLRPASIG